MKSQILRQKFFDFFVNHGHEKVVSSSLIPAQDPTLLFANAGMNQFKDVFSGKEKRSYKRAVSIQKCVRAGGKHNDLDNVGFTQRHLTFFEMMGNFSFGDYFKKEAIIYSWDFLTKEVSFDPKDLYVTVHHSDDEAFDIWNKEVGVPKEKIFRLGKDNFWQMGDTGPCGPCTEIFVDRTNKYGCGKQDCSPACGCDRFIEVWNNVFMQFDRQADGSDIPLKQTGVDTGMGLERLSMLLQRGESVFDTDLFRSIFDKIEELTGLNYCSANDEIKTTFNVLGDHIRSCTFLIGDGCAPANDGRGYVLRKIIRRAALFSQKITNKNIFPQLSFVLIDFMKDAYPELVCQKDRISKVLEIELERFADNLIRGKRILQEYMAAKKGNIIDGQQVFILYDTYGFPVEVTELIAKEQGFSVDKIGFEDNMEKQRQRSGKKIKNVGQGLFFDKPIATEFTGYKSLNEKSKIIALVVNEEIVDRVDADQECWIVAEKTPFYVECGGQTGDIGTVVFSDNKKACHTVNVLGLKKDDCAILIKIKAPIVVNVSDFLEMQVDEHSRKNTMKNHTATHLLQSALQQLFGSQVKQAGSDVTQDYLRFDFTYHQSLNVEQIKNIEDLVNQKILENIPVVIKKTTYKQAIDNGVIAFFGDKYNPDDVRSIIISDYSKELCGGTHVSSTGDIGIFKIIEEVALAAGSRRIIAYTGQKALVEFQQDFNVVKKLCQNLKIKKEQVFESVQNMQSKIKDLNKELQLLKKDQIVQQIPKWLLALKNIKDIDYLFLSVSGYEIEELREIAQLLNNKKPGFYFLLQHDGNKSCFVAMIDKKLSEKIDMKKVQILLQESCGLRGGGNKTMLQGSGIDIVSNCDNVIQDFLKNNIK